MTLAHSPIGASSMYRWSACPASVRLSRNIESRSSVYAQEGTEAHEWAAKVLLGDQVLGAAPEDMRPSLQVYQDLIGGIKANREPGVLCVVDFKYGAGVAVEVAGNPQLRYYALGALLRRPPAGLVVEHRFDLSDVHPGLFGTADAVFSTEGPIEWVEMVIVQPRCPHRDGPVRRERIHVTELLDFATELIGYAKATEDPEAQPVPGGHCHWCPAGAAGVCRALRDKANALAVQVFAPGRPYDPAALAETLRWLPVLENWVKNTREFAYGEVEAGRALPGWKLVGKVGRRKWKDLATAEAACKTLGLGEREMYGEPELLSPAQIEKALTARKLKPAERKAALEPLTTTESSGHVLVEESDPRPPARADAATVFQPVTE